MEKIILNNSFPSDTYQENLYYPRLQRSKRGEVILAISKKGILTKGILVKKLKGSKSTLPIGTKIDDWEVGGELEDYNGEVTITLRNMVKHHRTKEE